MLEWYTHNHCLVLHAWQWLCWFNTLEDFSFHVSLTFFSNLSTRWIHIHLSTRSYVLIGFEYGLQIIHNTIALLTFFTCQLLESSKLAWKCWVGLVALIYRLLVCFPLCSVKPASSLQYGWETANTLRDLLAPKPCSYDVLTRWFKCSICWHYAHTN